MQQMQQFLINPPGGQPQIIQVPLSLLTQATTPTISLVTANGQIIQIPTASFQTAAAQVEMTTNASPLATTNNNVVGFPSSTPIKKENDFLGGSSLANCLNSPNVSASPLACGPSSSATTSSMASASSQMICSSQMSVPSSGQQQQQHHQPPATQVAPPSNTVNGVNLEEIKEFAKAFKMRRLALGLTQTQLGQALSATRGPAYSQSAICRFEKLDITPQSAAKIKPVLEKWMQEVESKYGDRLRAGGSPLTFDELVGDEISRKKRKRRTSFAPEALSVLNEYFDRHSNPTPEDIIELSTRLNIDREVVRVWFCNKRQALKNMGRKLTTSASASMNASLSDELSNSFSVSSPSTMNTNSATLDQL